MPPPAPRLSPEHAEMLVLSVLAGGPAYGYGIGRSLDARSGGVFTLGPARLYPLLARLEKQGLVTTSWEEVRAEGRDEDAPGRRRKWYTLSPKGRRRLAHHIAAHRRYTALIDAIIPPIDPAQEGVTA